MEGSSIPLTTEKGNLVPNESSVPPQPSGPKLRKKHEPAETGPASESFTGLWVILLTAASIVAASLAVALPRPFKQLFDAAALLLLLGVTFLAWRAGRRLDPLASVAEVRAKVREMKRTEHLQQRVRRRSGRKAA
jgi:hypothetical protein